jgi:hypothetical protein
MQLLVPRATYRANVLAAVSFAKSGSGDTVGVGADEGSPHATLNTVARTNERFIACLLGDKYIDVDRRNERLPNENIWYE